MIVEPGEPFLPRNMLEIVTRPGAEVLVVVDQPNTIGALPVTVATRAPGTSNGHPSVGKSGGKSQSYEDWTVDELKNRAKELGLEGYSKLNKTDLIDELRNH
ncbi:Rho termination factor N-terminal domain-containing protein [Rhodococcus koreensis]